MHRFFLPLLAAFSGFCIACSTGEVEEEQFDRVLHGVHIVDVAEDKITENQSIGIRADTIRAIWPANEARDYRADTSIDATAKYVIPGLWDMHVHFRGGEELEEENKDLLPLYIAHGITSVRDAGGDMTAAIMEWRRQIAGHELLGPKIFTSGPKLDGPDPSWAGSIELSSVSEVPAALDSLEAIGVDYVKIYDSSISREVYLAIIEEAEKRGLKTTAHMPFTATLEESVEAGLDATEHMYYAMKASAAEEDSLTTYVRKQAEEGDPVGFYTQLQWYLDRYDPAAADHIFSKMAEHNTAVVPTLHIGRVLGALHDADHSQDSMLAYIGSGIQETYSGRLNAARRSSEEIRETRSRFEDRFRAMVPEMQESGVMILAGSDAGAYNSFVYPGQSLHMELEKLVEAGLTPAQALKSSVINGAIFMGVDDFYGSVEVGKSSDLLILNHNPLEDIRHTQDIYMLHYQNSILTTEDLAALLEEVRQ